jgi:hypothetical protein
MEYENHYSSKSQANLNTVLGALGTAAFVGAGTGGLGGIFGNRTACSEDHCVNRYEAAQAARIAELETEVKLRDANTFTMGEMGKLRDYVDGKFASVEREICDQRVFNTATTAALNCTNSQVAQLMALTKLIVPIASICPTPAVATPTTAG